MSVQALYSPFFRDFVTESSSSIVRQSDQINEIGGITVKKSPVHRWAWMDPTKQLELPINVERQKSERLTDTAANIHLIFIFEIQLIISEVNIVGVEPNRFSNILQEFTESPSINGELLLEVINPNFATQISISRSRLEEFESLEENWDSYGASPLDRQAIEEARIILKRASRSVILRGATGLACYPIPNRSGGVSLYFEIEDRELRLKLYPYEDKRVVYHVDKTKPEQFDYAESPYDRNRLEEHFNWLITGHG